jgi:hypothetical protein
MKESKGKDSRWNNPAKLYFSTATFVIDTNESLPIWKNEEDPEQYVLWSPFRGMVYKDHGNDVIVAHEGTRQEFFERVEEHLEHLAG